MSFDLRTHLRDSKTGSVTRVQPYRLRVQKDKPPVFMRNGARFDATGKMLGEMSKEELKRGSVNTYNKVNPLKDEAAMRAQIEAQVRAEMEARYGKEAQDMVSEAQEKSQVTQEIKAMDMLQELESKAGKVPEIETEVEENKVISDV